MYRILNIFAFIGCVIWLYSQPSPEHVVALIVSVAGFFRDDIHGVIGKNIFTLTPKNNLIHDLNTSKYSFTNPQWINPRILEDLVGWLSDSGDQIVSINITESNNSNRYFGEITSEVIRDRFPRITSKYDKSWFSYEYLGQSFSGVHLVQTWSSGGGSGVFCNILLVILSIDSAFEYDENTNKKVSRFVIKLIGSIPLGDKYDGSITYKFGILSISACRGMQSLRKKKSRVLVL